MDSTDHSSGTPFRPKTTNTGNTGRISMADNSSIGLSQRNVRASPYSPFPFGLPIQSSSRSILSPGSVEQKILENEEIAGRNSFPNESIKNHTSPHVLRGRVRAQDVYGGPLMFGGSRAYSTNRGGVIQSSGKSRNQRLLLSASPYHCAAASRIAGKQFGRQRPSNSSSTTPSPSGPDEATSYVSENALMNLHSKEGNDIDIRDNDDCSYKNTYQPTRESHFGINKNALDTSKAEAEKLEKFWRLLEDSANKTSELSNVSKWGCRAKTLEKLGGGISISTVKTNAHVSPSLRDVDRLKTSQDVTKSPTDSISAKNVATIGNIIPSDTNVLTSKSIKSSETQNLSTNSSLSKTFSFTPVFDLKQSTVLPSKDETSMSSRKFTFDSPIQQKEFHSDIDKESS